MKFRCFAFVKGCTQRRALSGKSMPKHAGNRNRRVSFDEDDSRQPNFRRSSRPHRTGTFSSDQFAASTDAMSSPDAPGASLASIAIAVAWSGVSVNFASIPAFRSRAKIGAPFSVTLVLSVIL